MAQLSIIILNFNTYLLTMACIASIIEFYHGELVKGIIEIIIVDNGSTDDSYKKFTHDFFGNNVPISVLKSESNLGFAKGCNIGAKHANGRYLLFLNSDTKVTDRGFLSLIDYLNTYPKIGIVGGKMVTQRGTTQASVGKFYTLFAIGAELLLGARSQIVRYSPTKEEDVDWVSGGCMMVRSDVFRKCHGFDEGYFMYMEDMDLCFRVKEKGYTTHFSPSTTVLHLGQGSSNRSFAILHIYQGISYYYKQHKSAIAYWFVIVMLITKALMALVVGILTQNRYLLTTYRNALKVL